MISFQIHDHLEIQKLLLKNMEKVPSIQQMFKESCYGQKKLKKI